MPNDHSASGFVTGFTLGMVAGACGFYLYATQDGARVRKQIREEFERAYAAIPEREKNSYPNSLRGAIKHFFESVWVESGVGRQQSASKTKTKPKSQTTLSPKAAVKSPRFKNTK